MSHYTGGVRTVCPFYLREGEKNLYCEGVLEHSENKIRFGSAADKRAWQERICMQYGWRRCPLASMVELRYEP